MQHTTNTDSAHATLPRQLIKKLLAYGGAFLSLSIVCFALWVLFHTLRATNIEDIYRHLASLSFSSIVLAYLLTALSYLAVTGYDVIAQYHIKRPLPYSQTCIASFLASTFGNNIGFAMVTGSSIRYRIYSKLGLSILEIAAISMLCGITTTIGMGAIFALSMVFQSAELSQVSLPIAPEFRRLVGAGLLALMAGYIILRALRPLSIRTSSWSLRLPSAPVVSAQMILATLNLSIVALVIYVLLPHEISIDPLAFLGVYALAIMASSASNVPGGLGVFETVLLLGLPELSPAALLGSIFLFRCIYYLTPLAIAAVIFATYEGLQQHHHIVMMQNKASAWWADIGPQVMGLMVLFAGCVLLLSSAMPLPVGPSLWSSFVPLAVTEIAHIGASIAGLGLIVLARGISRRLRRAYRQSIKLLAIGLICSILKSFGIEEASVLGIVLVLLLLTHDQFYRRATVFELGFTVEWVSLLTVILALTLWLGLFSYKDTPHSPSLWWYFALDGGYSRFLRSALTISLLMTGAAFVNLLRPDPQPKRPTRDTLEKLQRIIEQSWSPLANLALLGDKRILLSDSGDAFLMYCVKGKHWVALGDPVGPAAEYAQLLLSFRELCERYGGIPVFYRIDQDHLRLYLKNLALSVDQIGADARHALTRFSVKDSLSSALRNRYQHLCTQEMELEWVDVSDVPTLMPELQRISDAWLESTQSVDMGFARGRFDTAYLSRFPCAVVRWQRRPVAFAVLWASTDQEELAVDFIRYHPNAPQHVIDYLMIELMLAAQERGYRWFNAGMAPLESLEDHAMAPLWRRIGRWIFNHAEYFAETTELRAYHEQFSPAWRYKYIALPNGIDTPRALEDIAALIR